MDRNPGVGGSGPGPGVALRKESVDRNGTSLTLIIGFLESLSARRAWIEITAHTAKKTSIAGRSPQGERG